MLSLGRRPRAKTWAGGPATGRIRVTLSSDNATAHDTVTLSQDQAALFHRYLDGAGGYRQWFQTSLLTPVQKVFRPLIPQRLQALYTPINELAHRLAGGACGVGPSELALLHRATLHCRHDLAKQQEQFHASNVDAAHAIAIDALTDDIERALSESWLSSVAPVPRPKLTEFVNLRTARSILRKQGVPLPESLARAYDEKFGILWSPAQTQDVLEATRNEAWLLGTQTCVAFIDIDDFKAVNTALTETRVDREVLPPLMLLLEAATSSRGYAFRQGGDEYVVVLPNTDEADGEVFLNKLCAAIRRRSFGEQRITVSVGFFVASEDCYFTNSEILSRANEAKNAAKRAGKDRVQKHG